MLSQFAQYTEQKLQESGASIVTNQNFANNDPHVVLEQIKVHYGILIMNLSNIYVFSLLYRKSMLELSLLGYQ